MDNLLTALNEVSVTLLPVFGVLVLLFLAILLYKLIKMMTKLEKSVDQIETALKTTNGYLQDLDAPVKTVVRISKNVDTVTNVTENVIKTVFDYFIENFEPIKNAIMSKFKKAPQEEQTHE